MKRYIAAHKSEPGYRNIQGAINWIARQKNPEDYYVMEVTSEIPQEVLELEDESLNYMVKRAVEAALKAERQRIREVLGV